MDERYDATLRSMAAVADVIKVSDEDLRGLFRLGTDAGEDACAAALDSLRELNPRAAILYTRGERGAQLLRQGRAWQAAAPSVAVADTVGAGDASIGALLYSLMQHPARGDGEHLRFAVAAGAAACTAPGATPPSLDQVENLLAGVAAQEVA
jgi:fructokinase